MVEKTYFEDIIKDLQKQYPKLRFELNFDYYDPKRYGRENDYSYQINIIYDVNNVILVFSTIWFDSKHYEEVDDGIPHITIDKPMVSYIEDYTDKINDKYFTSIGTKGVEALKLIKDCCNYLVKNYKKQVLTELNKDR